MSDNIDLSEISAAYGMMTAWGYFSRTSRLLVISIAILCSNWSNATAQVVVAAPVATKPQKEQNTDSEKKVFEALVCVTDAVVADGPRRFLREAQINDSVTIKLEHFEKWVAFAKNDPAIRDKIPKDPGIPDLRLYLNKQRLDDITFESDTTDNSEEKVHSVTFRLTRNEANKDTWAKLLREPVPKRAVELSLGFEQGWILPTEVSHAESNSPDFFLILLPTGRAGIGIGVILLALIVFLWLAYTTEIVCDPQAPLRPDGHMPYSLARCQMAFWFFLVISSFFLIWVITSGDKDTITKSVLTILGISSGTALGAAIVDASKASTDDRFRHVAPVDFSKDRKTMLEGLQMQIKGYGDQLSNKITELAAISSDEQEKLEKNSLEQCFLRRRLFERKSQLSYLQAPPFRRVLSDLISENGILSFHRFQMFVWTLVLGIIFVVEVYHNLAMPEFDGTLLGLLGLSAGTYVGFKLPDSRRTE